MPQDDEDYQFQDILDEFQANLREIREFTFLKRLFQENPGKLGRIESLIRETLQTNIYTWREPWLSTEMIKEEVIAAALDFLGEIQSGLEEVNANGAIKYTDFFSVLKEELRKTDLEELVDLTMWPPLPPSSLTWKGTTDQLHVIWDGLKMPIRDGHRQVRFLDPETSFDTFEGIFKGKPGVLRWVEEGRSKDPTLSSLIHLLNLLIERGFIPKTNQEVLRQFVRSHFTNKKDGGISNLRVKPSPGSTRAQHIQSLVASLGHCERT